MATLNLSDADLIKIRSSWADVMAVNQFSDGKFVEGLFADLMARDASIKTLFEKEHVLKEQQNLFSELLKFTMMYLDRVEVLDECAEEFVKENPAVVKYGVSYLEPMGAVFIQNLRKTVGAKTFHAGMETLWVKVYIYIANCILSSDTSDVDSVMSNTADSSASEDLEEVKPLKTKSFSSPVPVFTPLSPQTNTINIDLGKNAKYKGFRRSVNEAPNSPIAVSVPSSPQGFRPPAPAFVQEEPVITPRSPRRNSLSDLSLPQSPDTRSLDSRTSEARSSESRSFDPRRKQGHRKTDAQSNIVLHPSARKPSTSSVESTISDVDDQLQLEDEIDFSQPRSPVFDHNSFGINGLAPIAESDDDDKSFKDNGSSQYDANVDKSSEEESSSRTSSLSLHNSDYKSSISSGSGHSRSEKKVPEFTRPVAQYQSPYTHNAYSSSVPSLMSRSGGQRASLGFMRSSYILKKEMNDLGYNHPENVASTSHLVRPRAQIPTSRSVSSLPIHHNGSFLHPRMSKDTDFAANAGSTSNDAMVAPPTILERSIPRKNSISTLDDKKKTSFRSKLNKLFGSSKSPRSISGPLSLVSETNPSLNYNNEPSFGLASGSRNSSKRLSSMDIRSHAPSGYACSVYSKPMTIQDNASIISDKSTRSIFRRKEKEKKNKYLVKKVPYKTIYLKDIVS